MKLFKMFKRGQKGFTLVELMVVMGIIVLLAGIVVPAVTGTKGPAEATQFKGDANAIQSAASKFNNDSVTGAWPEDAIGTVYSRVAGSGTGSITEAAAIGNAIAANTSGQSQTLADYMAIKWTQTTSIRKSAGDLLTVYFVPDFVPKTPASDAAIDGSAVLGFKHVYVWLFLEGAATNASTRTVVVYKLNDDKVTYAKAD